MSETCGTDVERINKLKEIYPGINVVTVSESRDSDEHIDCNFKTCRHIPKILERVTEIRSGNSNAKLHILLDYFWLQHNYYGSNYGLNWFLNNDIENSKCYRYLKGGIDSVILPHDTAGQLNEMLKDLKEYDHSNVFKITSLPKEEHHLWIASHLLDMEGNNNNSKRTLSDIYGNRGSNSVQTNQYLIPSQDSFITIRLNSSHTQSLKQPCFGFNSNKETCTRNGVEGCSQLLTISNGVIKEKNKGSIKKRTRPSRIMNSRKSPRT
jgi:hypothetical protein